MKRYLGWLLRTRLVRDGDAQHRGSRLVFVPDRSPAARGADVTEVTTWTVADPSRPSPRSWLAMVLNLAPDAVAVAPEPPRRPATRRSGSC